jgi:hypothetical protein
MTTTFDDLKVAATRWACGIALATHPGQSIWKAVSITIRPRKADSDSRSCVLNHSVVRHSGAIASVLVIVALQANRPPSSSSASEISCST